MQKKFIFRGVAVRVLVAPGLYVSIYRSYYPYPRKILQSRERQNDKISNPIVAQTSPHNILSRGFFLHSDKNNKICRFHGYSKSKFQIHNFTYYFSILYMCLPVVTKTHLYNINVVSNKNTLSTLMVIHSEIYSVGRDKI